MTERGNSSRRVLVLALVVAVWGPACKKDAPEQPAPSPVQVPQTADTSSPTAKTTPPVASTDVAPSQVPADVAPPLSPEEQRRRAAVSAELERYDRHLIRTEVDARTERERAFLKALEEVGRLTEELNQLQAHPKMLAWKDYVQERGTDDDKELFDRYQMPWCVDDTSRDCCVLPGRPPRNIGTFHWPDGMSEAEFAAMQQAPNARELMSPFTLVRRDGENRWKAVPFVEDPVLGPRMKAIAAQLRRASELTDVPSLRDFLQQRAAAFTKPTAFPWDESDYAWIALDGPWEVTLGPYEVYKNPRQVKARFQMVVGRLDDDVTRELERLRPILQDLENSLADLVGRDVYTPRSLDPRIALRAVRVLWASGDARRETGATAAYHLPNRGPAVDEGLYKKVILVNHMEAFAPIMKARAKLALEPALAPLVDAHADVLNTTFHELAHGFGAHDELSIRATDGTRTTVHRALGDLASLFEELKADSLAGHLVGEQLTRGWISPEDARKRYVSHLMHIFGLLQYPLRGTYPRMVATELLFLMEQDAVRHDPATGRWSIDAGKLPAAFRNLAKRVATIQLKGDRVAAETLLGRAVFNDLAGYHLTEPLAGPVTRLKETFRAAGIKSLSMAYEIEGL